MEMVIGNYNYVISMIIMMIGLYTIIASSNLIKKMLGLAIFQTSVLLFYIAVGAVRDSAVPILIEGVEHYVNPLPHVLMLTAIVVGVAVLAVGLALAVRICEIYGSVNEEEIILRDNRK